MTTTRLPKVGDYLYATCSAEDLGRIVAIGKDDNDVDTLDVEIAGDALGKLLHWKHEETALAPAFGAYPLTYLDLPPDFKAIIRKLQWQSAGHTSVELGTPDGGCWRCTQYFWLNDMPNGGHGKR